MYKYVSLDEGTCIFEEIKKQIKIVNKNYKTDIEFNFDQHGKIMDICNLCVEELASKNYKIDEFVKIASLCNALSIFPVAENKKINIEIMISLLMELTSKAEGEMTIENCSDELKQKIIEKIIKIQKDPRTSPYILGKYLKALRLENRYIVKRKI